MRLTNSDIDHLTALRRHLHMTPEISGQESQTARTIHTDMENLGADTIVTGLGGYGVAAVFDSDLPGPTVLFRCELDALPIQQISVAEHRSRTAGVAHLCGHDGHMAILAGLGRLLSRDRPARGRVVLLFQPAEETGAGAAAVLDDAKFTALRPDYAFALHNLPGVPRGSVSLAAGPVCCASRGLEVTLTGTPAHASQPETGRSPMTALSALMPAFTALSNGATQDPDFSLVTVTHAHMGEPAFGIAPGEARLFATLRTLTDDGMAALCDAALDLVKNLARHHDLTATHRFHDVFSHCENHPEATRIIADTLVALDIPHGADGLPWRPSEDFGRFASISKSALLFLGAGKNQPPLHNPHYDFPDDLIPTGVGIFHRIVRDLLG